ncbi:MAG: phage capsid protein [Shewanella sp.]|nr:phage capsid protein [Shewanella sp.]
MSFEITTAFVQQYKANITLLLQQRGSRLRSCCNQGSYVGKAVKSVDQIGPVEAVRRRGRHSDTPLISTPHYARWCHPKDYEWADMVDDTDKLRMLINPTSAYAINGAYALGRAIDRLIIDSATGTNFTGEDGDETVEFKDDNVIEASNTGLTISKLRLLKKKYMENEVDLDYDKLYVLATASQFDDLLGTTEVTSSDYNTIKALVQGKVNTFMGFEFIHTELLPTDENGHRRCLSWAKSGMHLGLWNDINTKIDQRPDKSYSTQVYLKATAGATRLDEEKVFDVRCDESVQAQPSALYA